MSSNNPFLNSLGIERPLLLAPMGAGPSTPALAAAVSNAGGLGSLGSAYDQPEVINEQVKALKELTAKPFGINLFVPPIKPLVELKQIELAIKSTAKYRQELGVTSIPQTEAPFFPNFDGQFEEVLKAQPKVFSFVFGIPRKEYLVAAKKQGILTIGAATSLEEALLLKEADVDAIVAQGVEAGGHRSIFDPWADDPAINTLDLVKIIKSKIQIPVIAAGGIMNTRDIQVMLAVGADAVQMGTAFLATKEAGTSAPYKAQLLASSRRDTKTTRAFSGRLARGIMNRFMREIDAHPETILPFPVQNKFTRDIRSASAQKNSAEFLSLWSGMGDGDLWQGSAADLVRDLFK